MALIGSTPPELREEDVAGGYLQGYNANVSAAGPGGCGRRCWSCRPRW